MDAKDIAEELQETVVQPEAEKSEEAAPEKLIPASRVTELIKKAKRDGEKKMAEQLEAAQQQIQQMQQQQQAQPTAEMQQQQAPQQQGINAEQIQQQVMQLMQKQMQEAEAKRQQEQLEKEVNEVAQQYFGKLAQGREAFEDFDAVTADFDPAAFPQLVYLATQADNTAAIIYELQKNPAKLAQLSVLVDKSPAMARNEIAKLSQSIKTNEDAKRNLQEAQDPLSRLKPSPVGTDNGAKTVRDYKAQPFLRA
jgi:FKBP-type peptidyl-prolyl cis-trans isomerase